jgi:hypothetical protein
MKTKYEFSIESKPITKNKINNIKWNDLFYYSNATNKEKIEIEKIINEEYIGKKIMNGSYELGKFDDIIGQKSIDKQVINIKNSPYPAGLIWFLKVKKLNN